MSRPATATVLETSAAAEPEVAARNEQPAPPAPSAPSALKRAARRWRGLATTIGANLGVFGLNALQGVILARLLGPELRGQYGTAVFYGQNLIYIGLFGTQFSMAMRATQSNALESLRRAAWRTGAITGLVTMVVVAALGWLALPADKHFLAPLCMLAACSLPWEHLRLSQMAVDHGSGDFRRYNLNQLLGAAALPAALIGVWLWGSTSLPLQVALFVLAPAAALAVRLVCRDAPVWGAVEPSPRRLLREGVPFAWSVLAADLLTKLDVLLMLWLASFSIQGYYAASVPAAFLLIVAPNAIALYAFNAGARHSQAARGKQLAALIAGLVAFQTTATVVLTLALPWLMVLVYGEDFRGAVPFALMLLPAYAASGCGIVADGFLRGRGQSKHGVRARAAGGLVLMGVVALAFGKWREMSIPMGAVAANLTVAVWLLFAAGRSALGGLTAPPRLGEAS